MRPHHICNWSKERIRKTCSLFKCVQMHHCCTCSVASLRQLRSQLEHCNQVAAKRRDIATRPPTHVSQQGVLRTLRLQLWLPSAACRGSGHLCKLVRQDVLLLAVCMELWLAPVACHGAGLLCETAQFTAGSMLAFGASLCCLPWWWAHV